MTINMMVINMVQKWYVHELVGRSVEVVAAANRALLGLAGKIVDETKSTLKLQQGSRVRTLLKNAVTLKLSSGQLVQGSSLLARPEERIKGRR